MTSKSERVELRLDPTTQQRIDAWRREQADVPAKSEAIRRLVDRGLNDGAPKALYEATRFQVLCAGLTEGPRDRLNDAYLYAWEAGVYPIYHDDRLATPFETHFRVGKEKLASLVKFVDREWLNNKMFTFYEIEDHFEVRYDSSQWDRYGLISAFRYTYLCRNFDETFWSKLLEPMKHPSEANVITRPFDREADIYFQ